MPLETYCAIDERISRKGLTRIERVRFWDLFCIGVRQTLQYNGQ